MLDNLVEQLLQGRRRALARLLTHVENQSDGVHDALAQLYPHTGKAWIIGVTGAPGTGKSSLVNVLAQAYRQRQQTVAIIAVDPTSPFSGGAILGDRIRMTDLSGDDGVFIRSMATRGSLGGLARATRDAVRVLDAGGFDIIIVETVGAGQSEIDIVRTAHTTLVIEAPGLGDDVQAIKAGILEIADILVVNKADRQGANQTIRALRAMLDLGHPATRDQLVNHHGQWLTTPPPPTTTTHDAPLWIPPVMPTVSLDATGIPELLVKIDEHRAFVQANPASKQIENRMIEVELYERLHLQLIQRLSQHLSPTTLNAIIEQVRTRQLDPQTATMQLLDESLSNLSNQS